MYFIQFNVGLPSSAVCREQSFAAQSEVWLRLPSDSKICGLRHEQDVCSRDTRSLLRVKNPTCTKKKKATNAHLCLMRPNSSPSSIWPLGVKSNSEAEIKTLNFNSSEQGVTTIDHMIRHLVFVQSAPQPSLGSHLQLAGRKWYVQ